MTTPSVRAGIWVATFAVALILTNACASALESKPEIRVSYDAAKKAIAFEAVGLAPAVLVALAPLSPCNAEYEAVFAVFVVGSDKKTSKTPIIGGYRVANSTLRFRPKYPLLPGVQYRAVLRAEAAAPDSKKASVVDESAAGVIVRDYAVPAANPAALTKVERIYPTAAVLPENQLKFYLHFSAPMRRGEAYDHVRLLDQMGKPIDQPFLEIGEEMWDASGRRLTLLIDPGRIKRGLKPREDLGPVFEAGKKYTLEIKNAWRDAVGRALGADHRKTFSVSSPIEQVVAVKDWKIETPAVGVRAPLVVRFPRPLDHALLGRTIWVLDPAGMRIDGAVTIGDEEKRWEFCPTQAWSSGRHQLVADTVLEDLAGNSIGRPFEVDELRPITQQVASTTVQIAFDTSAQNDDHWPAWRGPHANGTAPRADPPLRWDDKTNIRWKAPLPGRGSTTPIVWHDQVFVLTAVKTDRIVDPSQAPKADSRLEKKTEAPLNYHQFIVLCFDRNTGKLRWQHVAAEQVPHEGHHPTHSYAAGSPTTDGKRLYVSFGSFGVFCYDLHGRLLWQRDLGRLNTRLGWGEAVTPVVHGARLLLNWDQEIASALLCLNAETGATIWRAPRDEKSTWTTPLVVERAGRAQAIVNGTNRIRNYDIETGKVLWECGGMTLNSIPSAVADDSAVYCMSGYRGAAARAIRLDGKGKLDGTSAVLWQYNKGTPYVPSPLLVDQVLYFTQGNNALLTALDSKTGKPVLDRVRLPGVESFYASPVAAAGRVYLVDRNGTTLVLKRSDRFEVLATNRLSDSIDASPSAVGKQLFLRGQKHLYCIESQ